MYTDYNERIDIYVCCREIKSSAPQNDLQVRCYLLENDNWNFAGETEVCPDNLEPNFQTPFSIVFYFEIQQPIRFEILNVHNPHAKEILGTTETTVGAVMGALRQTSSYSLKVSGNPVPGELITQAEKAVAGVDHVFWQWQGIKLMNTDGRGHKSDPFLRFLKIRPSGDAIKVAETEVVMENLNPVWKAFEIPAQKLCYEENQLFRIECWDWERAGKYQFIGSCDVSLQMLENGINELELRHPKIKGKTGKLKVNNFTVKSQASFVDYIRGGTQLNAMVAIDFTGSNGDPKDPRSLHAMLQDAPNEYQKAITAVCDIILNYDYDQLVPVYGFGGKPHFPTLDMKIVSHCFPCTGNVEQQQVLGLQGILDVYSYALRSVELAGPTYFAPLINEVLKLCKTHKDGDLDIYTILLILTDGEIHDMEKTIDTIIAASEMPLSIIIVGIGHADFAKMIILDGDKGLKNSKGQKVVRDSVQFVPFKEFKGDMVQLAQHVLAEVPDQLVKYMKMMGKKPKEPKPV